MHVEKIARRHQRATARVDRACATLARVFGLAPLLRRPSALRLERHMYEQESVADFLEALIACVAPELAGGERRAP